MNEAEEKEYIRKLADQMFNEEHSQATGPTQSEYDKIDDERMINCMICSKYDEFRDQSKHEYKRIKKIQQDNFNK